MRIRRAATLACTFEKQEPVVHNFLTKEMFACRADALDMLAALDEWRSMEDALAGRPGQVEDNAALLRELIQRNLVLIEGSPQAERDRHYRDSWRWGAVTGFYHFSLRDSRFLDGEAKVDRLRLYKAESPSPPLLASNDGLIPVIDLPPFDLDDTFNAALYRRRSSRNFSGKAIGLAALADCLYAGNGLTEMLDAGEFGRLPLTMTPSGGARNPFELYVDVRAVDGLQSGIWHYSAVDHSLGFLHDSPRPRPSELLGNQPWTDTCAAMIFLAATFERSAWKYRQALAYRVVLMEVGAIVQNVQLAAAHHEIASAPTGALAESEIERLLELHEIEQGALFAVVLGDPAKLPL